MPKAQDDELVMNLVELALSQSPDTRESYVRTACEGDVELFSQVWDYVQWNHRMRDFLLEPLYAPLHEHQFEPGELLADRFRIVREVAQGGMGIVYEARDERLRRRIALKCAKSGFRKRLPPEVRHASEISHPNVCKIFEIHTASTADGEIDFLTMEYLEGDTLAARLSRGRLPDAEARVIARQICAGLAEAHRNRVVHGDLKSNNVILTPETRGADAAGGDSGGGVRAVITDFGLARRPLGFAGEHAGGWAASSTGSSAAGSSEAGGTPDYMAPELWKGEKPSAASDVYALGVILYELAAGHRPYGREIQWQDRLDIKPPALHHGWDPIVQRCLDPDPARRFHDAAEVAQALAPPRSRKWFLGAAAAAVVLAAISGVVTYQRATAPKESIRLAVLPFSSGPDTAALAESLSRDTAAQLAHLTGGNRARLTSIPFSKILSSHTDSTEKARAAFEATHVLSGTIEQEGGKVALHVLLMDARSGVKAKEWSVAYAPGELHYAPVALAGFMTGTLHLPPLAIGASVNDAAKMDYWNGLYYLRRNATVDTALTLLQRAVASDPDSALTHAALADADWVKFSLTQEQAWRDRAQDSLREAEQRNPDSALVHFVEGSLRESEGRYEQAAAEYRRTIELDPKNGDAFRHLGRVDEANNQLDEALTAFQNAVEAVPEDYKARLDLGRFYMHRENVEDAIKNLKKSVELAPDISDTHFQLANSYRFAGRFREAENEFRNAIRLEDTAPSEHNLGYTLMYQGRDAEAIPYYLRALALGPETDRHWLNLGISYYRVGLQNEAQAAFQRALVLAQKEMLKDPRNGLAHSQVAYLYARLGDPQRAATEAAEAIQLSPNDGDTRWMAVLAYEAAGRRDLTLNSLGDTPGSLLAQLSRYPELADEHRDSRFLVLLASHHVQ
jgi:eukaryotic-like serine/threonine-protein kinase